eukprot:1337737-Pleurochrysis_carterae.AAC.2
MDHGTASSKEQACNWHAISRDRSAVTILASMGRCMLSTTVSPKLRIVPAYTRVTLLGIATG